MSRFILKNGNVDSRLLHARRSNEWRKRTGKGDDDELEERERREEGGRRGPRRSRGPATTSCNHLARVMPATQRPPGAPRNPLASHCGVCLLADDDGDDVRDVSRRSRRRLKE